MKSAQFKKGNETPKKKLTSRSWVKGYVWQSRLFFEQNNGEIDTVNSRPTDAKEVFSQRDMKKNQDGNYGHASIETSGSDGIYASHWPGEPGAAKAMIKKGVNPVPHRTLESDKEAEQPFSATEITLYSLDKDNISKEYQTLKSQATWALKGTKINYSESCSSFSYKLLKAGGINDLSPVCNNLNSFFRVNPIQPNDVLSCLIDAKKEELKKFPETKDFEPDGKSQSNNIGRNFGRNF